MTLEKRSLTVLLLIILCLGIQCTQNQTVEVGRIVEIEPVALDVVLPIYDRIVVLFTEGITKQTTDLYENSVKNIVKQSEIGSLNKTLFAVCDLSKDKSGKLQKYGNKPSVQIITGITHYSLQYPQNNSQISSFFEVKLPNFYAKYTSASAEQIQSSQLKSKEPYNTGFTLLITSKNEQQRKKSNQIYNRIFDYLQFFNTSYAINKQTTNHTTVELYLDGELYFSYPNSAVEALFNFTTEPAKHQINDLVDFINIQTIEDVTVLNDENYYRVFGSSIDSQLLFIYREKDVDNQQIHKIRQEFKKAAIRNRKEGLKYQRVLFAEATTQFLYDYFSDGIITEQNQLYVIILTKTDYSKFQLRKFVYQNKEVTTDKLLQFIEDVRMKRIDASYKSEDISNNEGKKIRKIVGNNFQKQIFEQPEKSVMVLFVDSKEENQTYEVKNALEAFVNKYHDAYKDHMNIGVFDLAKNEHKLLTISSAPELVLFQRTNKKKPKFFKGKMIPDTIKNWVNFEVKDITIPENFGEPPIALGGGSGKPSTSQQL